MKKHELETDTSSLLGRHELRSSEIERVAISTPVYTAKTFKDEELNNIRLVGTEKPLHL
jgi:hypothetical protein